MASANIVVSKRTSRAYREDESGHGGLMSKQGSGGQDDAIDAIEREQPGRTIDSNMLSDDMATAVARAVEPGVADEKKGFTHAYPDNASFAPLPGRPANFGVVVPGVYRCSYPKPEGYVFLKELGLKSIVSLSEPGEPDTAFGKFVAANGITHHVIKMRGTKKEAIPLAIMKSILHIVLDQRNHPVLVHCNHGKHRTGCVVGVIRKVTGWQMQPILEEYRTYAEPKARECDVEYLIQFQPGELTTRQTVARSALYMVPIRMRGFPRAVLFTVAVLAIWTLSAIPLTKTVPNKLA